MTLVVNHLKSKGSDCDEIDDPDIGDGQARKRSYGVFLTHQVTHTHTPEVSRHLLWRPFMKNISETSVMVGAKPCC